LLGTAPLVCLQLGDTLCVLSYKPCAALGTTLSRCKVEHRLRTSCEKKQTKRNVVYQSFGTRPMYSSGEGRFGQLKESNEAVTGFTCVLEARVHSGGGGLPGCTAKPSKPEI
jgi:hypothetical protein